MGVLEINIYQIAVVLAVLLGKVNSQVTLSLGSQDPFQCDGKLRLRCTGTGSCCTQATGWTADGSSLTVGTSEDSKYKQENFGSYFDLVINKLELSDFNKIYTCAHLFDTSSVFKPSGRFYCNKCGGYGFLWVLSGVIVAFLICNLIVKLKGKKWAMKKLLVTSVASIFVSLTVSTSIAVPVCIINRLCQKTPRHDPLFILLGLAVEVMSFFIVSICFDKCCSDSTAEGSDNSTRSSCCPGSTVCPGPAPEEATNRRPHHVEKKAEKKERAQNVTHLKTEGSSKLDDVPRGRPLPQLKDISHIPASVPAQNNTIKLDPIDVSAEKKKKKKKKKKQADGEENVGFDE